MTASTSTMHDCGRGGDEVCAPLTVAEARTHFGAWAIVSSPLVLGFDLRNQTMVDLHWDTITNTGACMPPSITAPAPRALPTDRALTAVHCVRA